MVAKVAPWTQVVVPASTSNLGSGFDTLGLAVALHNHIRVRRNRDEVVLRSEIAEADRPSAMKMIDQTAAAFFSAANISPFPFEIDIRTDIPVARGLGFSATLRLGLVAALSAIAKAGFDEQRLLELVTALEGHPDNASPSLYGGFTVSGIIGGTVRCLRTPVSTRLKLVTLIPQFRISTEKARLLVPARFSKTDTVHALNRAALIAAAFSQGNYDALKGLFDDRVHQPYREQLLPQLSAVIRAGEEAGAIGGFLSGSGSAIMCLALKNVRQIGRAMQGQLPDSEIRVLSPYNRGLQVRYANK